VQVQVTGATTVSSTLTLSGGAPLRIQEGTATLFAISPHIVYLPIIFY
jgi:hypothetical protein